MCVTPLEHLDHKLLEGLVDILEFKDHLLKLKKDEWDADSCLRVILGKHIEMPVTLSQANFTEGLHAIPAYLSGPPCRGWGW